MERDPRYPIPIVQKAIRPSSRWDTSMATWGRCWSIDIGHTSWRKPLHLLEYLASSKLHGWLYGLVLLLLSGFHILLHELPSTHSLICLELSTLRPREASFIWGHTWQLWSSIFWPHPCPPEVYHIWDKVILESSNFLHLQPTVSLEEDLCSECIGLCHTRPQLLHWKLLLPKRLLPCFAPSRDEQNKLL